MSTMTMQLEVPEKALFTVGEVAELFCVTRKTVYRWIKEGMMAAAGRLSKTGQQHHSVRITRQEILEHLQKYS